MAHITTDNKYITVLCPKCKQEVMVDISTGLTNGVKSWYSYHCQHCGHIGNVEIESEHRAYNLDEIITSRKKIKATLPTEDTQIIDLSSLKRIADSLDEIKELLKEVFKK